MRTKINKKDFITILILIIILLVFTVPVFAQGLKWSESYQVTDCTLTGQNTDSANICYGTLAEYRTVSEMKALGFGGVATGITAEHKLSLNIMVLSAFNDVLWTGFNINTEDMTIQNLKENIKAVIGVSLIKFNGAVNK